LIGGSVALAARRRWPGSLIVAVDRADVVDTAIGMQAVDGGGADLDAAAGADLIVLAAPVRKNAELLERIAGHVPGRAVVTDVGSTKTSTARAAAALPARLRFVGGHPLAGAASGGLQAARADLFAGRPWLITPSAGADETDVRRVESFVAGLGARPRRIDAEAHDRLLAYLSHLPQLTASALMHVVGEHAGADGLLLAGPGLRDSTRLAASPADIWRDVAATNAEHVAAAIDDMIAVLRAIRDDLNGGETIDRLFGSAARWKRTLESHDRD
jgi:prephenate dehydrogenase